MKIECASIAKRKGRRRKTRAFCNQRSGQIALQKNSCQQQIYFDSVLTEFLLQKKYCVKESTYCRYVSIVEGHLRPYFGRMAIQEISSRTVELFVQEKMERGRRDGKGGLSPKRVRDILSVLKLALKYAREHNYNIDKDISFTKPKLNKQDVEIFSIEEEKILISFLREKKDVRRFGVLLSLFMGMRIGELCALQWKNIDLDDAIIHVEGTLLRIPNIVEGSKTKTKILLDKPKTISSARDIPIPQGLLSEFKEYRKGNQENNYLLTGLSRPIEPGNYYGQYCRWLRAAGITHHSFHALRHTFATRSIENGFDAKSLSEILGHADVKITLERYVHSSIDLKRKNMNSLPLYIDEL